MFETAIIYWYATKGRFFLKFRIVEYHTNYGPQRSAFSEDNSADKLVCSRNTNYINF